MLQTFVFADEARAARLALYQRHVDGPVRLDRGAGLAVPARGTVDFCTFFNAFSHRKWRALTGIDTLALRVAGAGRVTLEIAAYGPTGAGLPILAREVTLDALGTTIEVPGFATLPGELLAVRLAAGEDAMLTSAAWTTDAVPRRPVDLTVVVTTYRRGDSIRRTMAKLAGEVCGVTAHGRIAALVVDNGQDVADPDLALVTLVPSRNLGGAGGFARGLLTMLDDGRTTHGLFMDDDADCEPESIRRAAALLAHIRDPRAALSGAMLYAERPCLQYEKGARLDLAADARTPWFPFKHDRDLAELSQLCRNDCDEAANYGGWWFFAFPLAAIAKMPLPFFVRGDDIDFALSNRLPVVTLNGVAAWCPGFGTKMNAVTEYLAWRAWTALTLLHGTRKAVARTLAFALEIALEYGGRFDYATAAAVLDGLEDALEGPALFLREPAPLARLSAQRARPAPAPMTPGDFPHLAWRYDDGGRRRAWRRLVGRLPWSRAARPAEAVPHARMPWELDARRVGAATRAAYGEGTRIAVFERDRAQDAALRKRVRALRAALPARMRQATALYAAMPPEARTRGYWEGVFEDAAPVR